MSGFNAQYYVLNVSLTFYDPVSLPLKWGLDWLYGAGKAEDILIKHLRFNTIQKNSSNICSVDTQNSLEKDK